MAYGQNAPSCDPLIRPHTGSQCNSFIKGVVCSQRFALKTSLAALFCIFCSF